MANDDRLAILEALVARLVSEVQQLRDHPSRPPLSEIVEAAKKAAGLLDGEQMSSSPSPAIPISVPDIGYVPTPRPEWLPVGHSNGPAACGGPGVYLTQRVSGVHTASSDPIRILPRVQDTSTGVWINEPFRAPISSDLVRCSTCTQPLDLWTNRDLDYHPWLDNEIGQPMYPRRTFRVEGAPSLAPSSEEDLLRSLKDQAQQLREQTRGGSTTINDFARAFPNGSALP